jgi:hypothetical protein
VKFSIYSTKGEETGESGISVVVNRTTTSGEIFVIQKLSKKFNDSLIMELSSKDNRFAMIIVNQYFICIEFNFIIQF